MCLMSSALIRRAFLFAIAIVFQDGAISMDEPQPRIELSSSDESNWIAARYDSGAMPPGVASRVLKLAPGRALPEPSEKVNPWARWARRR